MKRRVVALLVLVLASTVGGAYYFTAQRAHPLSFTGFVEGEEKVIKSEITGWVRRVPITEGSQVQVENVLAEVDSREFHSQVVQQELKLALLEAEIRQAENQLSLARDLYPAQVRFAKANVAKAESDLEFARKDFERKKVLRTEEVINEQNFDQAKNHIEVAQNVLTREREALANAEANLRQIQIAQDALERLRRQLAVEREKLNQMHIILDKYTIRSPCECTVQTRLIREGEYVNPGTGIATLLDPLDKYVRIYIPVPDMGKVRIGDKVRIEPDALPGTFLPGEVSFIEDMAQFTPKNIEIRSDRITQVFAAKVRILENPEMLKPGMEGMVYWDERDGAAPTTVRNSWNPLQKLWERF
ncbi:MAG TPA: efflux RND transporter periplasmic adaptor subunit [Candidatus Binatia bacterium]|nr:efflux RND transporter periplasmic adaptor subunit [Candidatus Binatia bacterium]